MANKYYAVKEGREKGIFTSWEECKKQVMGYKGAVYKSFPSKTEAENYLSGAANKAMATFKGPIAYVDGSFEVNLPPVP